VVRKKRIASLGAESSARKYMILSRLLQIVFEPCIDVPYVNLTRIHYAWEIPDAFNVNAPIAFLEVWASPGNEHLAPLRWFATIGQEAIDS
jgi:hypothetical protein